MPASDKRLTDARNVAAFRDAEGLLRALHAEAAAAALTGSQAVELQYKDGLLLFAIDRRQRGQKLGKG